MRAGKERRSERERFVCGLGDYECRGGRRGGRRSRSGLIVITSPGEQPAAALARERKKGVLELELEHEHGTLSGSR